MKASRLVETLTLHSRTTKALEAPETIKDDKFYPTRSIVWIIGLMSYNILTADNMPWEKYNNEVIEECFVFKEIISKEARDFVIKCCTVDVGKRPDLKHLMDLPWLK